MSQEQISLTPNDIKEDPYLINYWCELFHNSNPKISMSQIGALAKKEFNTKDGVHKILHVNTINSYLKPVYKNETKSENAKKAIHNKSIKSRVLQRVKNMTKTDLMDLAKHLDEPITYVSK